jgi:hypothetical protein
MASNRTREPLRGAFIAILAAAIGAAGTLLGNQLASANTRHTLSVQLDHDDSARLYELRRDVYAKFISAVSQYEVGLIRAAEHSANQQSQSLSETDLKELTGDFAQLQSEWAEVQVVGSTKAAGLATVVRKGLDDILTSENLSADEVGSRAQGIEPKLRVFVNAAHDELNA